MSNARNCRRGIRRRQPALREPPPAARACCRASKTFGWQKKRPVVNRRVGVKGLADGGDRTIGELNLGGVVEAKHLVDAVIYRQQAFGVSAAGIHQALQDGRIKDMVAHGQEERPAYIRLCCQCRGAVAFLPMRVFHAAHGDAGTGGQFVKLFANAFLAVTEHDDALADARVTASQNDTLQQGNAEQRRQWFQVSPRTHALALAGGQDDGLQTAAFGILRIGELPHVRHHFPGGASGIEGWKAVFSVYPLPVWSFWFVKTAMNRPPNDSSFRSVAASMTSQVAPTFSSPSSIICES